MRPSRHAGRTLIAAVALLFATLLITETAYAQVVTEITQPATSLSQQAPSAAPHSGTGEDDCRPRQTARHTGTRLRVTRTARTNVRLRFPYRTDACTGGFGHHA